MTLLDFVHCRYFSEFPVWQRRVCCPPPNPIPPPPAVHLLPSLVSDLVKCSRTAAWRVLVQLINNSDNMIYGVRFAHKITVCNCLPNVFHACFFFYLFFFSTSARKRKGGEKKGAREREERAQGLENCEFIIQRTAHLSGSSWLGY